MFSMYFIKSLGLGAAGVGGEGGRDEAHGGGERLGVTGITRLS